MRIGEGWPVGTGAHRREYKAPGAGGMPDCCFHVSGDWNYFLSFLFAYKVIYYIRIIG